MPKVTPDAAAFHKSLKLWDRPEKELYGRPLAADDDTDAFVDQLFSSPSRGIVRG